MNVTDRFIKYTAVYTTSDENSTCVPSTERQLVFAKMLADELEQIGLNAVRLDQNGYVYGFLPASDGAEKEPCIGLIAHIDTCPDVSGENVKARRINYAGGDIDLGNAIMKRDDFPLLDRFIGKELITTDGSTLLGADDKAGVAEIITTLEYLIAHPEIKHGKIAVGFTVDEEIGSGADHFDLKYFGADWAYTVDGGELGEIEYENFNAASAKITVHGVNIHPGSAKGKMKNAALIACEIVNMLPASETPATTEGYEGFYHVNHIEGNESLAKIHMIIRDHDAGKFTSRKDFIGRICDYINAKYGEGTLCLDLTDSYYNMKEMIQPHMHIIDSAKEAFKKCGVEPKIIAIRGGTDGARLSFEGLPCPNLSTGGFNMHSIFEFIPSESLEKMVEVLTEIVRI